MSDRLAPGWIYVLTHPAWDRLGLVEIGRTGRNPRARTAGLTSIPGLLAPGEIACCLPVSDMAGAEQAVHRMLAPHRVRRRRALFRVDVATARRAVRAVAGSQPPPDHTLMGLLSRPLASRQPDGGRRHRGPRGAASWRPGWRRVPASVRLVAGLLAIGGLIALLDPSVWP